MKHTIKEFLYFINDGSIEVEDSCDTNYFEVRNYKLKIYVDGDDNVYTSIDELPNKNVNVCDWRYKITCFDKDCLEIWCN